MNRLLARLTNRDAPYVFIAHAKADASIARRISEYLEDAGIQTWFDEKNLIVGSRWEASIRLAVKNARCFLVCFSSATSAQLKTDRFIKKEIQMALEEDENRREPFLSYFIPVLLEDIKMPTIKIRTGRMSQTSKDLSCIHAIRFSSEERALESFARNFKLYTDMKTNVFTNPLEDEVRALIQDTIAKRKLDQKIKNAAYELMGRGITDTIHRNRKKNRPLKL